eukprot:547957-Amphidinium_carterae.1
MARAESSTPSQATQNLPPHRLGSWSSCNHDMEAHHSTSLARKSRKGKLKIRVEELYGCSSHDIW